MFTRPPEQSTDWEDGGGAGCSNAPSNQRRPPTCWPRESTWFSEPYKFPESLCSFAKELWDTQTEAQLFPGKARLKQRLMKETSSGKSQVRLQMPTCVPERYPKLR